MRIIAATHRNLQAMVEDGTFREDLYYRLNVIPLTLPPLRERTGDIAGLVAIFFEKFKQRLNRPGLRLPSSLLPYFGTYRWPGNVRELENVVERLVVLTPGDDVTVNDLPDFLVRERPAMEAIGLDCRRRGSASRPWSANSFYARSNVSIGTRPRLPSASTSAARC